jgi:hypothetical protein
MANITSPHEVFHRSLISGSVASIVSAVVLAIVGKKELNKFAAPLNGPSQWIWGRQAPYENRFTFRYTVMGYGIHHAASIFWAIWYERFRTNLPLKNKIYTAVAPAAVTTATAYVVDFYLTPKRLRPGFENRLSKRSLIMVYGAFAVGLAAPGLFTRKSLKR